MHYFGAKWESDRDLSVPVQTPVGARCDICDTQIFDGERGFVVGSIRPIPYGIVVTVHRECDLMRLVGHSHGICERNEHREPAQVRADALALWEHLRPAH